MTIATTLTTNLNDEYGGEYAEAFAFIHHWCASPMVTGIAETSEDEYDIETSLGGMTYRVNYWYSAKTKNDGMRSRPLLQEIDGKFTNVFEVDLEHEQSIQIQNSAMEQTDKILQMIRSDLNRRFPDATI